VAWKDAAEERGEGGWRGTRAIGGAGGVGGGHSSKKQEGGSRRSFFDVTPTKDLCFHYIIQFPPMLGTTKKIELRSKLHSVYLFIKLVST
jgi:hypothetical protein